MFVEEMNEIEFESNRGRDAFIEEVMDVLDNNLTNDEIEEISKLLEIDWLFHYTSIAHLSACFLL